MKKSTLGIILFLVVGVCWRLLNEFGGLEYFSGVGLVVTIIVVVLWFVIFRYMIFGDFPKTKKEAKGFEYKGIFNPLFPVIVFGIVAITWTFAAYIGKMTIAWPIGVWIIFIFLIFYWRYMKKFMK